MLKSIDGPRTDVADVTTITYYAATDTSGCGLADDVLRMHDANGLITDFEYDGRRRLTAVKVRGPNPATETDDLITTQVYDDSGNLIRRTAPDGSFVAFAYDARDRLIEITGNLGNRIVYTLDSEGTRIRTLVDPRSWPRILKGLDLSVGFDVFGIRGNLVRRLLNAGRRSAIVTRSIFTTDINQDLVWG